MRENSANDSCEVILAAISRRFRNSFGYLGDALRRNEHSSYFEEIENK